MNQDATQGKRILYVEDDVAVLTAYRDRLQKAGFEVESSADGLEAMRILSTRTFDLIILDLLLPRFSGTDILKAIREDPRLRMTPVILFSSNVETVDPAVLTLGDRCLLKGDCTVQKLMQAIGNLLASNRDGADA
jgi:DNA-binding response OmpR family regulator